VEDRIKLSKKM